MSLTGRPILLGGFVAAVAVNLLLMVFALERYPAVVGGERTPVLVLDAALLLAYAGVAVLLARGPSQGNRRKALAAGSWSGIVAAAIMGADLLREDALDLAPALSLGIGLAAFMIVLALFSIAGATSSGGRISTGAIAGAWSGMVAMLALWIGAWVITYALMERLEQILVTDREYLQGNTLHEVAAYTIWNTLSSASSHALLLPVLGAGFGALGSALARGSSSGEGARGSRRGRLY